MRLGAFYQEASEHECLLTIDETGATLFNVPENKTTKLVEVSDKGIRAVVPMSWESQMAFSLARMMRAEVKKLEEEAVLKK